MGVLETSNGAPARPMTGADGHEACRDAPTFSPSTLYDVSDVRSVSMIVPVELFLPATVTGEEGWWSLCWAIIRPCKVSKNSSLEVRSTLDLDSGL